MSWKYGGVFGEETVREFKDIALGERMRTIKGMRDEGLLFGDKPFSPI